MRRLVIIGSQGFMVDAMQLALRHAPGFSVFCVTDTSPDLEGELRECHPDLVALDAITDPDHAFASLPRIHSAAAGALVIVLVDDPATPAASRATAAGTVVCTWPGAARKRNRERRREAGELRRLELAQQPVPTSTTRRAETLTSRERETLAWVAEGHTNASIARKLWVTEQTVKFHLTNIYRKLHVENRTEACNYALAHGLVPHTSEPANTAQPSDSTHHHSEPDRPTPDATTLQP